MQETREEVKTVLVKVFLSEEAKAMLDEIAQRRFPGRPRVQSQTAEQLVREEYARMEAKPD